MQFGKKSIPEEDLKDINTVLGANKSQAIVKKGDGSIIRAENRLIKTPAYAINDFRGKTLKHNKSVFTAITPGFEECNRLKELQRKLNREIKNSKNK